MFRQRQSRLLRSAVLGQGNDRGFRSWAIFAVFLLSLFVLANAPELLCESVSVEVSRPVPPIPIKQKARVRVNLDGKPLSNATVSVQPFESAKVVFTQTADEGGYVTLPAMLPGHYQISVVSTSMDAMSQTLDVCLEVCDDFGVEVVHFAPTTLSGPLKVMDTAFLALDEISVDLSKRFDLSWRRMLEAGEGQQVGDHISEFRGVVRDPSGAVIPGASIDVVVKGTNGKDHVARIFTDREGRFSADLPKGEYVAFVVFQGFTTRVFSFAIDASGTTKPLEVVLNVGAETETVVMSAS